MATPNIKTKRRKDKLGGVCCDENTLTCNTCSFEESIKITDDETNNE